MSSDVLNRYGSGFVPCERGQRAVLLFWQCIGSEKVVLKAERSEV